MKSVVATWLLLASLTLGCSGPEPLPVLFPIPATELVSMQGQQTTLKELNGNVVIYDFIFTRCSGICPLLSKRMKQLTLRFDRDQPVRFASISVDPINDTPQVLTQYARQFGADDRWNFYTGERQAIIDLSVKGFKLAAGEATPDPKEPILHSTKFVLADGGGNIRGYYDSNDTAALDTLVRDASRLSEELR